MDQLAAAPQSDRSDVFTAAGNMLGLPYVVVEKDFWVCWTLKQLFDDHMVGTPLIFKGGTSLSKAFGIIERFSEDIDISIHKEALGFSKTNDPQDADISRTEQDKRVKSLRQAAKDYVRDTILPRLTTVVAEKLPPPSGDWRLRIDTEASDVIWFSYPQSLASAADRTYAYVASEIKLEFGAGSDPYPIGSHLIRPFAADVVPKAFNEPECMVTSLEAERTFWEKATLLHAEYHRPEAQSTPPRISRHYSDLARLAQHPLGQSAAADLSLLQRVAAHKAVYFRSGWANYASAQPGSLRILPHPSRLQDLREDYGQMRSMFFTTPPEFGDVIQVLMKLEQTIDGD